MSTVTVEAVEIIRVGLPLVHPFRTVHGDLHTRDVLLVRVVTEAGEGWGEVSAFTTTGYTAETVDAAAAAIERFLAPALVARAPEDWRELRTRLTGIDGFPAVRCGLEVALADARLRASGTALAADLGAVRDAVEVGVVVGFEADHGALLDRIAAHLDEGYGRVKVKIRPGWDREPLAAIRERYPDLPLQVDANGAYAATEMRTVRSLDDFDLEMVEQPFPAYDLASHARLVQVARTPVCLDESITSEAAARRALSIAACTVVTVKPATVGGLREAIAIHDLCVEAEVPLWCGGMLESGVGRAASVALAALPGFTRPADLSASARYFARDLTEPFVLEGSTLRVPTGPGLGVRVDEPLLASLGAVRRTVASR